MDAPAVAVSSDGKKLALAWMDTRRGDRDVQWTVGAPGKMPPEATVHDDAKNVQGHPSLVFDKDGNAWCAWEDFRGGPNNPRIYAAESKSRKNVAVSAESEGKAGYPSLASGGGLVAAAYEAGNSIHLRILAGP
jgi:beta-xylosidase